MMVMTLMTIKKYMNKYLKTIKDTNTKEPIGKVTVYLGDKKLGEEEVYIKKEEKVTLWHKILKIIGIRY